MTRIMKAGYESVTEIQEASTWHRGPEPDNVSTEGLHLYAHKV